MNLELGGVIEDKANNKYEGHTVEEIDRVVESFFFLPEEEEGGSH